MYVYITLKDREKVLAFLLASFMSLISPCCDASHPCLITSELFHAAVLVSSGTLENVLMSSPDTWSLRSYPVTAQTKLQIRLILGLVKGIGS